MAGQPIDPIRVNSTSKYDTDEEMAWDSAWDSTWEADQAVASVDLDPAVSPASVQTTTVVEAPVKPIASESERPKPPKRHRVQAPPRPKRSPTQRPSPSARSRRPQLKLTDMGSQAMQRVGPLSVPMAWFCFLAFCGGTGLAAFLWLTSLPPLPNCQKMTAFSTDAEKLFCADQASKSGKESDLVAGLELVKEWPEDHPLSNQAKKLVGDWSKLLLRLAKQKVLQQDLDGAIALAKRIPKNSPDYEDVKEALDVWQKLKNEGRKIEAAIVAAIKTERWDDAHVKLQDLAKLDDTYSRQNLTRLRFQVNLEQMTARKLQDIRKLVKDSPGKADVLGQAITLAQQLDPATFAFGRSQKDIGRWKKTLLEMVRDRLAKSDWVSADAASQQFPLNLAVSAEERNLLWVARGQMLTTESFQQKPLYEQVFQLVTVIPQVQQVGRKSPLHAQAKGLGPKVEQQLQDNLQLELSQAIAQMRVTPALQLASTLTQSITPKRPQRQAAQALIAEWRRTIEVAEDYPILADARQMVKGANNSIEKLRDAIAKASQIGRQRPLRVDAQTAIAEWENQVETIEDRPILERARSVASGGNLNEAIKVASKIREGRALHGEAQSQVWEWIIAIQIAEDQPILDRARALASEGSLSSAIAEASRIGPGRALYSQAQGEIGSWAAQRDAIVRGRDSGGSSGSGSGSSGGGSSSGGSDSEGGGYSGGSGGYSEGGGYSGGGYSGGGYSGGGYSGGGGYSEGGGYSGGGGYSEGGGYSGGGGSSAPVEPAPAPAAPAPEPPPAAPPVDELPPAQ